MKFTDDILKLIIQLGADGMSISVISRELNTTPDQLRDLRKNNSKLNDALERAEYNYDQYILTQIENGLDKLNSRVQVEAYKRLVEKHNANSDNEIIIRRV